VARPLPAEMVSYAREDTHYLLYVLDMMRNELIASTGAGTNNLLSIVWEVCCLSGPCASDRD
jgi:exosome complex exonuclease RRP6